MLLFDYMLSLRRQIVIDHVKENVHIADFLVNCSSRRIARKANGILSVHYQIGGFCRNAGECINFLCKLNIFILANSGTKDDKFPEEINATINKNRLIFP